MHIGQRAFNFTLLSSEGRPVSLQETLDTHQAVLLIFLRHLG